MNLELKKNKATSFNQSITGTTEGSRRGNGNAVPTLVTGSPDSRTNSQRHETDVLPRISKWILVINDPIQPPPVARDGATDDSRPRRRTGEVHVTVQGSTN